MTDTWAHHSIYPVQCEIVEITDENNRIAQGDSIDPAK